MDRTEGEERPEAGPESDCPLPIANCRLSPEASNPEPETSNPEPETARPDSDALRASLAARFDAWLRGVLADERPPEGLPAELLRELDALPSTATRPEAEEASDRAALWAAMTALTQEVKLQGRAFGRLQDSLAPLTQMQPLLGDNLAAHEEALRLVRGVAEQAFAARAQRDAELASQAERRATRALLDVLLDARDRLARGLGLARAHVAEFDKVRGWRAFLGLGRAATRHLHEVTLALEEGYRLTLQRIEEALGRLGVHAIDCLGAPFDPHLMTAADIEDRPGVPDGTVLEVYRNGYAWNGETLRPAQVKVARASRRGE